MYSMWSIEVVVCNTILIMYVHMYAYVNIHTFETEK